MTWLLLLPARLLLAAPCWAWSHLMDLMPDPWLEPGLAAYIRRVT